MNTSMKSKTKSKYMWIQAPAFLSVPSYSGSQKYYKFSIYIRLFTCHFIQPHGCKINKFYVKLNE